jgi:hypothetical protein
MRELLRAVREASDVRGACVSGARGARSAARTAQSCAAIATRARE